MGLMNDLNNVLKLNKQLIKDELKKRKSGYVKDPEKLPDNPEKLPENPEKKEKNGEEKQEKVT